MRWPWFVGVFLFCASLLVLGSYPARAIEPGSVEITGAEEVVFDYTLDACHGEDIPDVPAQAFRDIDDNIQMIASHMTSYRMIGPSFDLLVRDCSNGAVFESDGAALPETYSNDEWLVGVYTTDGAVVFSLVHNEYKPLGAGQAAFAWYNTLTFATSADTGRTYTQATAPEHYLAGIPYQYQYGAPMGIFGGSSPVFNEADGYYYVIVHLEQYALQDWGVGVIRTQTLFDAGSWRGWDGTGFNVSFVDPYNEVVTDPAAQILAPVSRNQIGKMSESLTYNTYFGKFMVVGFHNKYDGELGSSVYGLYYALSDDIINWSEAVLLMESDVAGWGAGGIYYPSLIDHNDTSRNFETPGQEASLYYTRWNGGTYDRDLCRVPVRFLKSPVSGITAAAPAHLHLEQNSPNPFNPRTWISYTVETAGHVVLTVFDARGREVDRLLAEWQTPGRFRVEFQPPDLPSGVYFYRLQVGAETAAMRKMVLIR